MTEYKDKNRYFGVEGSTNFHAEKSRFCSVDSVTIGTLFYNYRSGLIILLKDKQKNIVIRSSKA